MKRTNISLTEEQYEKLRQLRHTEGGSMSYFARIAIQAQWLTGESPEKKPQNTSPLYAGPDSLSKSTSPISLSFKPCKHGAKVGLCKKGCK